MLRRRVARFRDGLFDDMMDMLTYGLTPVKATPNRSGTLDPKVLADKFFALAAMHEGRHAMTIATSPGIVPFGGDPQEEEKTVAKVRKLFKPVEDESLSQHEFDREINDIEEKLRLRAKFPASSTRVDKNP